MKKKNHQKEKLKRKRGKKYKYDVESEKLRGKKNLIDVVNPFEEMSNKKFLKSSTSQFSQLINDYRNKNNVNYFKDNRLGEGSKNLTEEQKNQMRFKAQQMLKKSKKKNKFNFDDDDDNNENIFFTHNGKKILSEDSFSIDDNNDDDDNYNQQMKNFIDKIDSKNLNKHEKYKEIILKSKQLKEEKQKIKEDLKNKINYLDENFSEINVLLKKRKRQFNTFNDEYDKLTKNFIYLDKTKPTDRIKTKEEIEREKDEKLKKIEKEKFKEEVDNEESEENEKENDLNEKHLTKKERIEKLIQERLSKSKKIQDKIKNDDNFENEEEEEENEEDNLDDLNEEKNENEYEEEEEDEENEENEENEEDEKE